MDVLAWLLDADPSIRWQVLRDVTGAPGPEVAAERARVAREGWGAAVLALQDADGRWDGGTYRPGWVDEQRPFFDAWTATHFSLSLLRELGVDPTEAGVRRVVTLVRANVRWEANDARYFEGETEPCINGHAVANGAYFGEAVDGIVDRLLRDQLEDGGWNCWAESGATVSSFHSTICVVEGLLAWERAGGSSAEVTAARGRAEEYLLQRRLYRRLTDGSVVDPRFTMSSFPAYWYYDVLRALDHLRAASRASGGTPDPRCAEAIELIRGKRTEDGRWLQENRHEGPTLLAVDRSDGLPSRWITLRAMRVLAWWDGG
jgi:hypothetical protein